MGKFGKRKGPRGNEMRWIQEDFCLVLQWIDNKVVPMMSTTDKANDYVEVTREVKVSNE